MALNQANFFDEHPVLYPWPALLRRGGFCWVYKLRDAKFRKFFDSLKIGKGDQVLDVGCGDGVLLARLVKTYSVSATGVDFSPLSIQRAKLSSDPAIKFLIADAVKLPFKKESFDLVFSFDTLEHIKDSKGAILEMVRVLKPGGKLLLHALNKKQKFTWNWWLDKLGVDVYEGYAHDPDLFLDPQEIKQTLGESGLVVDKICLFHAFLSLAVDEVIMVLIKFFPKNNQFLGRIFLNLANFFSLTLPVFEILDRPWTKRGYSNSFFIIAQKKT